MPIDFESHWNPKKVEVDEHGYMEEEGLLYTEGLGPCIGVVIAYGHWAGVIHSSTAENDADEYAELIAKAKAVIPEDELANVHPLLSGSDPDNEGDGDSEEYEEECMESRAWAVKTLKAAGFGEPRVHWCEHGQTGAVFADLKNGVLQAEVDYEDFVYPIPGFVKKEEDSEDL